MIALLLLWAAFNAALLLAGIVVLAGLICSLLAFGTWHRKPWFWRAAVAVSIITAFTDIIERHWIHMLFACAGAAWTVLQLENALKAQRSKVTA